MIKGFSELKDYYIYHFLILQTGTDNGQVQACYSLASFVGRFQHFQRKNSGSSMDHLKRPGRRPSMDDDLQWKTPFGADFLHAGVFL